MTIKETIQFEQNLYKLINTCGLPMYAAFYVFKSVYLDFEKTLYQYADKEATEGITESIATIPVEEAPSTVTISDLKFSEK